LDELVSQEFVYWSGKIVHRGWFLSWQIKMVLDAIQNGNLIFKAIENKEEKDNADKYTVSKKGND
jgi:subtilisin-like proprotein convertase family protein